MRTVGQVRRGKLLIMALVESIAISASVQAWIRQENGLAQVVPAGDVRFPLLWLCLECIAAAASRRIAGVVVVLRFSRCPRRASQLIALHLYTFVLCFHLRIKRPSKDALWVTEQRRSCQASRASKALAQRFPSPPSLANIKGP